jgi:hypothetical protein
VLLIKGVFSVVRSKIRFAKIDVLRYSFYSFK